MCVCVCKNLCVYLCACVQLVDQGIDLWIHDGLTDLNGVYDCTPFLCVYVCMCVCVRACG